MAVGPQSGSEGGTFAVARASAILITLLGGGCAQAPTTAQVASFGKAASSITMTLQSAEATSQELRREQMIDLAACGFLSTGQLRLAVAARRQRQDFGRQVELIEAIATYADALAKATDPAEVAKVEAASSNLATASAQFAAALPGFSSAPIIAPIATLMGRLGSDLIEYDMRRRLRAVIEAVNPRLVEAVVVLNDDLAEMAKDLRASLVAWRNAKECVLRQMRSDTRISRLELYDRYREADRMARDYETRAKVLDERAVALGRLSDAHQALLNEPTNINAALASLQIYAAQLLDVRRAVAALPTSTR